MISARFRAISLAIGLLSLLGACQPRTAEDTPSPPAATASLTPAEPFNLTVYAAASLTDAMAEIETTYEDAVPGADLVVRVDSSAALRIQIEEGAPADVFLSADTSNPDKLVESGLADGDPVPYAGNDLALIVPADNPAGIRSPADVANDGVQIVAAGDEVPITGYTVTLLDNLAALPGYPADFVALYTANVVSQEDNVKGIVTKIEQGVGDAGFVYQTDALASTLAASFQIPKEANVHAPYAGIVVADSAHPDEAAAFLAWLAGPVGQAILETFGFVSP